MADVKISQLTALASASVDVAADVLAVVDTSVPQTKKLSVENLLAPITINKASGVITNLGTVTTADINGGTWQGTIDGAWTASGVTCANLGTVSAATSITSTAFVGNIAGNLTGTVLTASQSAITSVGTLTTLTVDDITLNGSTISDSGDLTIDSGGRLDLSADDNGEIRLYDGSSMYAQFKDDSDRLSIEGLISDADMLFVINDGGSATTAMKFDAASGGDATFYGSVGIGTASPLSAGLDISWGGYTQAQTHALTIGANIGDNTTRTDNGRKMGQISGFHYDNQEDRISLMRYDADSSTTELLIGGTSELCGVTTLKFLTASSITATPVERMQIDSHGTLTLNEHTTDADKSAMLFKSTKSYADDEYENFNLVGTSSLIIISDTTSNDGGVFFASYNSGTVTLIADPQGEFRNTDTDNYINCWKSSDTSEFHVKNRRGSTKNLSVAVIGCGS
jgi:hypothetical protein